MFSCRFAAQCHLNDVECYALLKVMKVRSVSHLKVLAPKLLTLLICKMKVEKLWSVLEGFFESDSVSWLIGPLITELGTSRASVKPLTVQRLVVIFLSGPL